MPCPGAQPRSCCGKSTSHLQWCGSDKNRCPSTVHMAPSLSVAPYAHTLTSQETHSSHEEDVVCGFSRAQT